MSLLPGKYNPKSGAWLGEQSVGDTPSAPRWELLYHLQTLRRDRTNKQLVNELMNDVQVSGDVWRFQNVCKFFDSQLRAEAH